MLPQKYHFVGVGGVGMNPLAQLLLALGNRVSGSDRFHDQGVTLPALEILQRQGLALYPQDGSGITADINAVVVSTAVETDNPDLAAARRHGLRILHRSELLAQCAANSKIIGISGTAGKTTTTGMIGWVLEQAGFDPTVVNGGALLNWRTAERLGNFRRGASPFWVLELDESDRSFLRFQPTWAVITNISKDHFELAETEALFADFRRQAQHIIAPADLAHEITQLKLSSAGANFCYKNVPFHLPVLGRHNVENAFHCIRLCETLGITLPVISTALEKFRGIERRLEFVGQACGARVFDDYAHNPAKIAAAWEAIAPWHRRLIAVWRPHGFKPLETMWTELNDTFHRLAQGTASRLFFLPVFFAGGTAQQTHTAEEFAAALAKAGVSASCLPDYTALETALAQELQGGDALLLMGARDPQLPGFARDFCLKFGHLAAQ